jgi:hypothetical protein
MDWSALNSKRAVPPIVPEDPGPQQCNNFDEDFTSQVGA